MLFAVQLLICPGGTNPGDNGLLVQWIRSKHGKALKGESYGFILTRFFVGKAPVHDMSEWGSEQRIKHRLDRCDMMPVDILNLVERDFWLNPDPGPSLCLSPFLFVSEWPLIRSWPFKVELTRIWGWVLNYKIPLVSVISNGLQERHTDLYDL